MKPAIVVIGSIIMDFPLVLPRPAISGETLKVHSPGLNLGGKAVNQGRQALLCDTPPVLVEKVGNDVSGEWARAAIARYHLSTRAFAHHPPPHRGPCRLLNRPISIFCT